MKVGFYFEDRTLTELDYRTPYSGNLGIGGTQYCFILLIHTLKLVKPDIEIHVFSYHYSKFAGGIKVTRISNFDEVILYAQLSNIDYLILKQEDDKEIDTKIKSSNLKFIVWGHNFYFNDLANRIATNDNIVANVFVGKQQYDRYIDHIICKKSTYIHNMVPDPLLDVTRANDSKTVVYLGALVPSKGFLLLAKQWKAIIKEVPDAKLKVIGNGLIYDRKNKLGPHGIAEESYENEIFHHLSYNEQLMDSVEFMGLLGAEKFDIFTTSSVGVVNPSARTETFGMGIIEMACAYLPVVTLNWNGFPDTIIDRETGFLCKNQREIKNKIIYLLKNPDINNQMGHKAKEWVKHFSPTLITQQWIDLLEKLHSSNHQIYSFDYLGASKPYSNNLKWIRIINRFLRDSLGFRLPSFLSIETFMYKLISK